MADALDDTEEVCNERNVNEVDDALQELDLTKKKKKKKKKTTEDETIETGGDVSSSKTPWEGSDRDYSYTEMLDRVFNILRTRINKPGSESGRRHLPPPQMVRVGTRKTMWTNFAQICQLMQRQHEHVMSFVLSELGTEGSIDGNMRLVIKGRYLPKQIESLLKKYIMEYVSCHMCRTPETSLTRDPVTRLYFLQCETCGSRRSVAPIKSGFHATSRTDRRAAKAAAN